VGNCNRKQKLFYIQKRIVRIMAGAKMTGRDLFKKFNILPLASKLPLDPRFAGSNKANGDKKSAACLPS
jgi:hypothetical protein